MRPRGRKEQHTGAMLIAARRPPGRYISRPGAAVLALASGLLASTGLAVGLVSGAAQAQEALIPVQKAALLFTAFRKFGGKVRYGSVAGRNGALTIRDLKLEFPAPGDRLSIRGRAGKLIVTAETMFVHRFDYRNPDLPRFADLAIMGVRPGGNAVNERERSAFRSIFGRDDIVLDIAQNYALDPAAGSLDCRNFSVALRGVAALGLAVRLDGIDFAGLSDPDVWEKLLLRERHPGKRKRLAAVDAVLLAAVPRLRLHALSVSLTDLGGVEQAMAYAAEQRSQENPDRPRLTPDSMRDMAAGILAGFGARFSGILAAQALREAGRFVMAPGTLTAAAKPAQPLSMTRLAGFAEGFATAVERMKGRKIDLDPVQKFLGLSVSYTPAAR